MRGCKSVLLGKGESRIKAEETELDLYSTFPPSQQMPGLITKLRKIMSLGKDI